MAYQRTAKIKILDEVNCAIIGLTQDHIDWFYDKFARKAPNYYFNPLFKLGSWDGNIRYFHQTGKTFVFLLPDILPKVKAFGYKMQLMDQRTFEHVDTDPVDKDHLSHILDENGEPIELRYYQVEAVNAIRENNGGIVIAGTGAGKTMMNAVLVDIYGKAGLKTLTIVPSQDLVKQTRDDFILWGLDTGEYSGTGKDLNHTHIVSTWQSVQNLPSLMKQFKVVVVDECHGLKGKVLTELLIEHGKDIPYRFGLTGTLPKAPADAMTVRTAIGEVQYEIPAHRLIAEQYLAKMHIDIFQLEEDFKEMYEEHLKHTIYKLPEKPPTYTQFKDNYFPEWSAEKRYLQTYKSRLEWIAHLIEVKRDARKGNVLCLVNGVQVGKKLAKMVDGAIFVHGQDKQKARKQVYDMFQEHDNLVVIATVNIASTGLNIKRIFNMMFIDAGKSFIRVIQSIGRGLRKAHDKDYVSVTDVCSDLKYSKRHVRDRISFYREAQYPFKKTVVPYEEM